MKSPWNVKCFQNLVCSPLWAGHAVYIDDHLRLSYLSLLCWPLSLDTHRKLYNNSLITLPEFLFQDLTALENL